MESKMIFILLTTFLTSIVAETTVRPPARILKQINRQNEDGSYSYGYENDDGSYKIETKSASGEIVGKYGYIDVDGKLREIEYGASKRGFEPVGPGIKVPPPTVHSNSIRHYENGNNVEADYDDGQYREDPSIYYKGETGTANELGAGYNTKFETVSKQVLPAAAAAAAPVAAAVPQLAVPQQQHHQYLLPDYKYETTLRTDPSAYRWFRPGQHYLAYNNFKPAYYQGHASPLGSQYDVFGSSYTINYAGVHQ